MLTARFRAATARDDAGAIAIIVALMSLLLFGVAALAIDLGEMYSRRRAAQTDADFAALAGAAKLPDQAAAFALAYEYLEKNLPSGGPLGAETNFSDGNLANGEILFPSDTSIRVVVPPRTVEFGFAGVFGFSEADVTAAATAGIQSPAATLPFFLTANGANGYSCLKDTSGGGPNNSVMREALAAQQPNRPPAITSTTPATLSTVGGETLTVNGDNFRNPAPTVTSVKVDGTEVTVWTVDNRSRITLTTPAHAAGTATLTVTNAHGTASTTLTYVAPPPAAAPTVTGVAPASGPEVGGTDVTITGTGFSNASAVTFGGVPAVNPTITNATTIEATSPPGTGAVHVQVTNPGGTSAETDADVFTYESDACAGVNGSFGYLDIPRSQAPTASGANSLVMINIAAGIDHGWTIFPGLADGNPAEDDPCKVGNTPIAGAVLDDGDGVDGANCIDIQNGNKTSDVGRAFLEGYSRPGVNLPARMLAPDGHDEVSLLGHAGMDGDSITDYLNVPLTTFTDALADGDTPTSGWLDADILQCPRFAIVPILNVGTNPPNGFYPIKSFAGVFIDGPSPNHGFDPNNNNTQVESIRAYAFSLDYLPETVGSGTTGTTTYLGTGPKIPVLVHDAGDPSY